MGEICFRWEGVWRCMGVAAWGVYEVMMPCLVCFVLARDEHRLREGGERRGVGSSSILKES